MIRLFYGDDRVAMEEATKEITAKLGSGFGASNLNHFDGASLDIQELLAACRSMPFLGNLRVVLVRDLAARLRSLGRQETDELVRSLATLPPSTDLILLETDLKGDASGHPLFSLASKEGGEVRAFSLAAGGNIDLWIAGRVRELEMSISREAAQELARRVGEDALQLRSEIEKLVTYCLDRGQIEVADVRLMVTPSAESSVFDLVDAIGRRESRRALSLLQDLVVLQGEQAANLLGMIGRQFRLLLMVKDLITTRVDASGIANYLGTPVWQVRRFSEQSRQFTVPELERALELTLEADYAIKGGGGADDLTVMAQLVAALTMQH